MAASFSTSSYLLSLCHIQLIFLHHNSDHVSFCFRPFQRVQCIWNELEHPYLTFKALSDLVLIPLLASLMQHSSITRLSPEPLHAFFLPAVVITYLNFIFSDWKLLHFFFFLLVWVHNSGRYLRDFYSSKHSVAWMHKAFIWVLYHYKVISANKLGSRNYCYHRPHFIERRNH